MQPHQNIQYWKGFVLNRVAGPMMLAYCHAQICLHNLNIARVARRSLSQRISASLFRVPYLFALTFAFAQAGLLLWSICLTA